MCRIAGVTNVTDKNRTDVWLFMMVLGEHMSKFNNDGLGYAAFDKSGNIFGERWLYNKTAFSDFSTIKGLTLPMIEKMYSFFGDKVLRNEAQSIILHARAATCEKNIANTHPFINDIDNITSAIIHNGVITNEEMFPRKYSTCDSEVIVHLYEENKVAQNLENIRTVAKQLFGWFTVLALTKDNSGNMVMDMFTDGARLHSYFVKELDTRVYSTSWSDIEATAKDFGLTLCDYEAIKQNTAFRVDVLTGKVTNKINSMAERSEILYAEGSLEDYTDFHRFFGRKW